MSLKLIKSFVVFIGLVLLSSFGFQSSVIAGVKEAKEIVNGGKWYMTIAHKQSKGFNATIIFDGKKTVKFFSHSHTMRGKYRVSGGNVCLTIYKLWGNREKCGATREKNGVYSMGNFILRKRR